MVLTRIPEVLLTRHWQVKISYYLLRPTVLSVSWSHTAIYPSHLGIRIFSEQRQQHPGHTYQTPSGNLNTMYHSCLHNNMASRIFWWWHRSSDKQERAFLNPCWLSESNLFLNKKSIISSITILSINFPIWEVNDTGLKDLALLLFFPDFKTGITCWCFQR